MSIYSRGFIYLAATVGGVMGTAIVLLLLGSLWPRALGYDVRIVESGSMEPAISVGAVVLTRPEASYQVGDVVTYQRRTDQSATTHRLIQEIQVDAETAFLTQGDANNVADVEPVRSVEIAGKVWLDIPYLGYVLSFFQSPLGFLVLVLIPAILIVWEQIVRIRRTIADGGPQDLK